MKAWELINILSEVSPQTEVVVRIGHHNYDRAEASRVQVYFDGRSFYEIGSLVGGKDLDYIEVVVVN